jgi:excisionase family DNA binding protein
MNEFHFYSIIELSEILKLHPKTVLRFIHEDKIKATKIGRAWKVSQEALKEYAHAELALPPRAAEAPPSEPLSSRVTVSAVIEIKDCGPDEASRLSNSFVAALNSKDDALGKARFDSLYYPDIRTAKYVAYGEPRFISEIMRLAETLSIAKE